MSQRQQNKLKSRSQILRGGGTTHCTIVAQSKPAPEISQMPPVLVIKLYTTISPPRHSSSSQLINDDIQTLNQQVDIKIKQYDGAIMLQSLDELNELVAHFALGHKQDIVPRN